MKLTKYIYGAALGALSLSFASCYNADKEFPDFEGGTTAYFAYQNPVRTIILGNDIYDNSLDNAHKCRIWATMGGAYNGRNAVIEIAVADSLCKNLFFVDEQTKNLLDEVKPMPSTHYSLASNTISYNGDQRGYVEVNLTDAFFNDPKSIENTYVIPILMKNVKGIDKLLTGTPREGLTPQRVDQDSWDVPAKDYVLYCVKYINPWHAKYIRRGVDNVTEDGVTTKIVRKDMTLVNTDPDRYKQNMVNSKDEVCAIKTKNMTQAIFPVTFSRGAGKPSISCNLILTFNGNSCTISSDKEEIEVSGSGEYIVKGSALDAYKDYQWGSLNGKPVDRDILRLAYNVNFKEQDIQVSTADTLVVQTRESNQRVFFSSKFVKP